MDFTHLIPDEDLQIAKASGLGAPSGWGSSPALLIVDAQYAFVGNNSETLESLKVYPRSIGKKAWKAVEQIGKLQEAFRAKNFPLYYSIHKNPSISSPEYRYHAFARKHATPDIVTESSHPPGSIIDEISPNNNEVIIEKMFASPFFGTPFASFLFSEKIDTLVVSGFVTSGCVRGAIVDAHSFHLKVILAEDACADRFESSHYSALFDTQMKYGDVIPTSEILEHIKPYDSE